MRCDWKGREVLRCSKSSIRVRDYYLWVPDSRPDKDLVICESHQEELLAGYPHTYTATLVTKARLEQELSR